MGKKHLIGKKVRGFEFDDNLCRHSMREYVGEIGVITEIGFEFADIQFDDGAAWSYPLDQIEQHLVEEELPSQYEVGMTVWDIIYGKGEIEFIDDTVNYPVSVQFKSCNKLYTSDGKPALYSTEPTLSLTPYDLVNGGATFPTFKHKLPEIEKGTLVYVRDNAISSTWHMRFFSHFDGVGNINCFKRQYVEGDTKPWPEYSLTNPLIEKQ